MQYVVLDLEWNQPLSYQSSIFKEVGDRLIFDMIQIGAVKLNEAMQIIDAISLPIRPEQYVKIHPRVRRMTRLGQEELKDALTFREAFTRFMAWCGQDCTLLTWGCDDVSVLKQNIDFYTSETPMPQLYDLQLLFSEVFSLGKERKGLKYAMELLQIDPREDRDFHNALNDAFYTAQVFSRMPDPGAVLRFSQQPKRLVHVEKVKRRVLPDNCFPTAKEALAAPAAQNPRCFQCNKPTLLQGALVPQTGDKYVGLATCRHHGDLFVKVRLMAQEAGCGMLTATAPCDDMKRLYVRTKQALAEQAIYPGNAALWDPEAAFRASVRTNMPFEE